MEKLVALLYILMRDELPTGVIPKILNDLDQYSAKYDFTNKGLETYSRELVERIMAEKKLSKFDFPTDQAATAPELHLAFPSFTDDQINNAIKHGHSIDYINWVQDNY